MEYSRCQEIPCLYRTPRLIITYFQKSPLLSRILSQLNPILSFTPVSLAKINFNIMHFLPARLTFPHAVFHIYFFRWKCCMLSDIPISRHTCPPSHSYCCHNRNTNNCWPCHDIVVFSVLLLLPLCRASIFSPVLARYPQSVCFLVG
jgi:hypothetical protein